MGGGRSGCSGLLGGGVPEGAPVVLERFESVGCLRESDAHVAEWKRRPVGEVLLGRRTVPREVAPRQFGERGSAIEPSRGGNPIGEAGIGVRAVGVRPAAADQCLQFEISKQDREPWPVISEPVDASTPARSVRVRWADASASSTTLDP